MASVIDPGLPFHAARRSPESDGEGIITLAALAVGGQGGGVLTNWIVDVAEANGYLAQSTSVAGVAQRTGATIYYVEMCRDTGRAPVMALAPAPGDVDILIASELIEAGRAVMRGFVTPGRTTLIASTHRIPAVSEKIVPGDGRADSRTVIEAMGLAADRVVALDLEALAQECGTVISATLLGALAASGALPFPRESYEQVIRATGKGAEASLRGFSRAYDLAMTDRAAVPHDAPPPAMPSTPPQVPPALQPEWNRLRERLARLPEAVRDMAGRGLEKVVDYQDLAYGHQYLDMIERVLERDGPPHELTLAAAKYAARALCYDDILRVADLKTRATRQARIRSEMRAAPDQLLHVTEYFHPRFEEFVTTLPRRLGSWLRNRPQAAAFYRRYLDRGRRLRSDRLGGFLALWLVAGLRRWRRALLRHQTEMAHVDAWFDTALRIAHTDRALAAEVLANYRLIKGYSDTHSRGQGKFARLMQALPLLEGRTDAADWMRRLRTAALADEEGKALEGALATVASFAEPPRAA
ncbi:MULTISPECIES: indolepyruvate oxidoreductase subunit beta family protein [unclassified Paracoccus (in: a-proteobacteria)]|uniref:indolepyruvate oxidoreductase subunit beta family protein n=1 Tax=unclassified Paracoccus (in: a-proteobacteria) TaxID=2688777 RepID=UPI0021E1803C|nr:MULTISPECIES: indolepyruvate oxidoreductase subunit beta family protein [unclassified Paracoccus (in: a-proteobacteria)]UXU76427.1 indolepyruvate oxidoreductase subunit beta family protein [Paracoccus sp. SMMA_5]UXU82235.1 indolepyruvate oxidoreductase subunit beta family protein [Paracoccus sp. SMMA_5_TC]